MTTAYTENMGWQRMMDLSAEIHRLRDVFIQKDQGALHEDLRFASIRALTAIARLVSGMGQERKTAPDDVRSHLRDIETIGLLAHNLGVLSDDHFDRIGGIFTDVKFLLKSQTG
ncbi:MAG: four helix bundle protein [Planctomycetota bacterium]|jgi:hypothetical protein|nr:four helix bundle protein [Planctomycetota bacterium]